EEKLIGNVEFKQGGTTIKCDVAKRTVGKDPVALLGHVQILDESRSLFADTVYVYQDAQKQVASGNVISITASDTTTAQRITYYDEENKIVSEQDVRIVDREENRIVTGERAEYLRDEKYGEISGNPTLTRADSLGNETMRVKGDTMEVFKGGDETLVRGNVKITNPNATSTCGQAVYFKKEEKTLLTENPKVIQRNRQIVGDTLWLFLEDSQLSRASVVGHASATSDADTLNKGRWVNKLSGQNINFYFEDKQLKKVIIDNQATSLYHIIEEGEYKGANEVSGDKIIAFMSDGVAKRVVVKSDPDMSSGKYVPPR
ncbi:hypothetical protein GWO43_24970, partial [candidate division KSB1 bacterium]|nr:hypothetical protein [candidate division KSB1 bacterium]NIR68818.1 hypothetical protein [candidate division KSB1 bacterium]NIS27181.1 hypothetical protein [candidate division KSB1 bacterium]NIT74066.1 hypothetical protein [candidate division KSB1 bacterium]NIU26931.1 hypothetical protein [candidate division KSB1 bacterium]